MSVVVRIQMPKWCWDCPCVNGEYGYCQADKEERQIEDPNERPSWCPIIAVSPWHRVEDELPEKFVNVILANKRGKHYDIDKGWWNGYSFDRCAKGIYRNVTHWMPLPEPPKEEE